MFFAPCRTFIVCAFLSLLSLPAHALTISLSPKGPAVVWSQSQTVTGTVSSTIPGGTLYVNDAAVPFTVTGTTFSVPLHLSAGTTTIAAAADSGGLTFRSDTLLLTLGYPLKPEVLAYAEASGMSVTLHAAVLDNPDSGALSFQWTASSTNPAALPLGSPADSVASFSFPRNAPAGEYYFTVRASTSRGDTARATTFVTLDGGTVRPFNILTDHARWIDSAIIYQAWPQAFVDNGKLQNISDRIPNLAQLGINTLYLQPIFATYNGGQGYDVTDYFSVRPTYGSLQDLQTLVRTAHARGMRVILDFVPNHSSIHHAYAQDAIQNGASSHYYDFYQRTIKTPPVLGSASTETVGKMTFVYYFDWSTMPNLNYANPELLRMIIEAGKFWIEQADIDGYRADAVWAINERSPAAMREWRLALKRLKPDILLLAEDKAPSPLVFDGRFDAAYDWAADPGWVSHWSFQTTYSSDYRQSATIFNAAALANRSQLLGNALTNNGHGFAPGGRVLRFLENNDLPSFRATHSLPQNRMAAALVYSMTGIPMMYNGEEIGCLQHPYNTTMIFSYTGSIRSQDKTGLFDYYARLCSIRKSHPALWSTNFQPLGVTQASSGLYAFRRWAGTQNMFTVINMGSDSTVATLSIPTDSLQAQPARTYYLTDLLTGQSYAAAGSALASLNIPMPGYSTRLMSFDTVTVAGVSLPALAEGVPGELRLAQNYPNPFNPATTIAFELPGRSHVRLVVSDLLGKEVATLVDAPMEGGPHAVTFNAGRLASGLYFYRLEVGGASMVRKMMLLK